MLAILLLAAEPNPETATIGYEDVVTIGRDAETLCPLAFDENVDPKNKGLRLKKVIEERNYRGPRLALLNLLCGQWEKGYLAGVRRGPR